ncbi:MAG: phosphoribosyltransferase [Candidatus Geothermincolia bacterium]
MAERYRDREHAGSVLAELYRGPTEELLILGIPRGGLAVGWSLSRMLRAELDAIVTRKLPIPLNPESGFGAIAPDGSLSLNPEMLRAARLTDDEVHAIAAEVLAEIKRREDVYRGSRPFPQLDGRNVLLTDDGLATGYTMLAAIDMVLKMQPAWLSVAVPCSPSDTADLIRDKVDELLCPIESEYGAFAVAMFYEDFHEMSDDEVIGYLEASRRHTGS